MSAEEGGERVMVTCADCVHVKMCQKTRIMNSAYDYAPKCDDFKDRSRFVELPCKVGDKMYVIEDIAGEAKIIQDVVETIGIGYYADGINIYQFDGIKTDGYFSDFGKTVFLTHEEAEQALKLKERENNAN